MINAKNEMDGVIVGWKGSSRMPGKPFCWKHIKEMIEKSYPWRRRREGKGQYILASLRY